MIGSLKRWIQGGGHEAARRAEELGLKGAASLAARVLGESLDDDGVGAWQLDTLGHFLDRLTYDPDGELPAATDVGAVETCAKFIGKLPPSRVTQISHVLAVFEAGPLVLPGEHPRRRFSTLDADHMDGYIDGWASSDVAQRRTVFAALKSIGGIGYWSREATWPAIGYSLEDNPGVPGHVRTEDQE